jgi:hypothetical protein
MSGFSLLAPIPVTHLQGAVEILAEKEFVLFGSEAFDVFEKTEIGTKVLIYVSHDAAEPVVSYTATYGGFVGQSLEMRRLEREGYRPPSTMGEKWSFYWKIFALQALAERIPLSEIQLASGGYLKSVPRGPLHVIN